MHSYPFIYSYIHVINIFIYLCIHDDDDDDDDDDVVSVGGEEEREAVQKD